MIVTEKKSEPYTKELKMELFVIGHNLGNGTYVLLDKQVQTFKLKGKSATKHEFKGKNVRIQHDPYPGYGIKLENYFVIVSTSDGVILATKGKKGYQESLTALRGASINDRFTENLRPMK